MDENTELNQSSVGNGEVPAVTTPPIVESKPESVVPTDDTGSYSLKSVGDKRGAFGFLKGLMGAEKSASPVEQDNAFTKLFGKQEAQHSSAPSLRSILGAQSKVSVTVLYEAEKKRRTTALVAMDFALIGALAVFAFFYFQLNPNATFLQKTFKTKSNVAVQFDASNARLEKAQTEYNLFNYMSARVILDDINTQIDPYQKQNEIFLSNHATPTEKLIAEEELKKSSIKIVSSLKSLKEILAQPLGKHTFTLTQVTDVERDKKYETLLVAALNDRALQFRGSAENGDSSIQNQNQQAQGINAVLLLVQNKSFLNLIKDRDLESLGSADLSKLLISIREQSTDEFSTIQSITKKRLMWSEVIQDVHFVTSKVDTLYGQGLYDLNGGFQYTGYGFDAETGKISIRGSTKTSNSKTFSFISALVERIEGSRKFKNVDLPTFSKSKGENGEYTSSLNLSFDLQGADEVDSRDDKLSVDIKNLETAEKIVTPTQ